MGDEKEGPYKVLASPGGYSTGPKYSIILRGRGDFFYKVVVPDAGSAETSRDICNMFNREWKALQNDDPDGADEAGIQHQDQRDGDAGHSLSLR